MPKPEIKISYFSKREAKRNDVTTVCIGDVDGDGKEEIISGGGISEDEDFRLTVMKGIQDKHAKTYNISNGFVNQSVCFDLNHDKMDEIICGNKKSELFFLQFTNGNISKSNSISLKKKEIRSRIEDIKVIEFNGSIYIFSCSSVGNIAITGFSKGELQIIFEKELNFRTFSLLPFVWNNKIILLVGGDAEISIFESDDIINFRRIGGLRFTNEVKFDDKDKRECVDDIFLLEVRDDSFKFICGCRSTQLILFKFSKDLELLSELECDGSIYNISSCDIDQCGKNELLIAGRLRGNEKNNGFISICKIGDDNFSPVCTLVYKERIFSILPFFNKDTKRTYLLASAENEELVTFKVIFYDAILGIVSALGTQLLRKPGEYCFFIGAGMSSPIYPLADELSNKIIQRTNVPRENIVDYLEKHEKAKNFLKEGSGFPGRIPLEAILFWYKIQFGKKEVISFLLESFDAPDTEVPRRFAILGKLMKDSLVDYTFSVNYDSLLETEVEIDPLLTDEEFTSTKICQKKAIMKFHGSVSKPESMVASLDEVSELSYNKKAILDFLFTGHTIFFVGYSCRDPDLFPALNEIVKKYGTDCYFVDPCELSEQAKKIIESSGKGDVESRHFQISAELFFEYFISKIDKEKNEVVINDKKEVN